MYQFLLTLPVAIALAACPSSAPRVVLVCPDIKTYSPAQQAAAAEEFKAVRRSYPVTTSFIADYLADRDSARACQAKQRAAKK